MLVTTLQWNAYFDRHWLIPAMCNRFGGCRLHRTVAFKGCAANCAGWYTSVGQDQAVSLLSNSLVLLGINRRLIKER